MKKYFLISALAGAALMMAGCKKDPTPDSRPIEIELRFSQNLYAGYDKIRPDSIRQVLRYIDPHNVTIYLVPEYTWYNFNADNIHNLRKNVLEPALSVSSKIRGRGDFDFSIGQASRIPEDCLWYVKNGWTINKYLKDKENRQ